MKKLLFIIFILIVSINAFAFTIVENKEPKATIIIGKDASVEDIYAKDELIKYVEKITGAKLPTSEVATDGNNIYVGESQVTKDYLKTIKFNFDSLKKDGILISVKNNNMVLAGDNTGTIYAVYTFLENSGVCFMTSESEYVPKKKNLEVKDQYYTHVSPFISRDSFFTDYLGKEDIALKLKLNGNSNPVKKELGGHVVLNGFAHTFNNLLNPAVYGKDHPEWFTYKDGKRIITTYSQPCLSNKEIVPVLIKNVLDTLEKNPDDQIISVTQNDTENYCQCENCKAMAEKYGQSGLLLSVINQVADAVKEKYPDKFVETFAYQYTREAPKGDIVPRDNVIIRLCSIECDACHPFDHPNNKDFYKDLKDWSKICKHLYIWDYVSNFSDYLMIHPNIQALQKNIQIMRDNNVIAVFSEGDYSNPNSCLNAYKRYIIAKLLWDPNLDMVKESKKFLKAYYGPAAKDMEEFIKATGKPFLKKDTFVLTFSHNNNYYTSKEWIAGFSALDKALACAKNGKIIKDKYIEGNKTYYDRVFADMLCYYCGYTLATDKVKSKVEASRVAPFRNTKEFSKILNEVGPTIGLKSYSEKFTIEKGLYSAPYYPKDGVKPELCKDLADTDWVDYQNNGFIKPLHQNKYCMTLVDETASNGKCNWVNSALKQVTLVREMNNIYLDDTVKSGDVYIVYRIEPGTKKGVAYYGGLGNRELGELTKFELSSDDTPDAKYTVKKIGEIDFTKTSPNTYIWFSGSGDKETSIGMYVDRAFVILHR